MPIRPKAPVIFSFFLPLFVVGCFHAPVNTNQEVIQVEPLNQNTSTVSLNTEPSFPSPQTFPFTSPEQAELFKDSVPQSQDILPQAPLSIVIDSTLPLSELSTISVVSQGVEYGVGQISLNANKLSVSRAITQSAPDGLYTVRYSLCDQTARCSNGSFQFAIDSFWISQYQNWTSLSQVTVSLTGNAFLPRFLRVSQGTVVTWKNEDVVSHTVDSDPYITHSYNPSLSSFELKPGESYSFTFGRSGWYPYRCALHPQTMTGVVIVE